MMQQPVNFRSTDTPQETAGFPARDFRRSLPKTAEPSEARNHKASERIVYRDSCLRLQASQLEKLCERIHINGARTHRVGLRRS